MTGATRERWRTIPGYSDAYEVSDLGRIRSVDRIVTYLRDGRFISRSFRGMVLSQSVNRSVRRHMYVHLYRGSHDDRRMHLVHRLVLEAFLGPCPDGMEGCHNNGDPTDNRLQNLRWDTHSSNMRDMRIHGTDRHAAKRASKKAVA